MASRLYGALVAALALAAVSSGTVPNRTLVVAVGVIGVVTLLAASRRVKARPSLAWAAAGHDPFPLFALGAALLVAAFVVPGPEVSSTGLAPADALVALAAGCAAAGFLVMIRDATPRRALDSLFMCAIGAAAIGFVSWVLVIRATDAPAAGVLAAFVIPVIDLCVVGLALVVLHQRTAGRRGPTLLLLSWLVVFASHLGEVVGVLRGAEFTGGEAVALTLVALGLLGVAAFDPATSQVPEPRLQPLRPLPALQVGVLVGAVLLGPAMVALHIDRRDTLPTVVVVGGLLSGLVFAHLLHLVQGRAVIEHRAHHDDLTGLPNRSLLGDRTTIALAHARRSGARCAVLFVDLDRFKKVNDSLGHAVGNLLLTSVAQRLRGVIRAGDTVARLGGDEFVVLLAHIDAADEAAAVAENILAAFAEPFIVGRHRLFSSPSIGIAVSPDDGDSAEGLLKAADIAMYRAKQRGRQTFCIFDRSMNDEVHERLELESELHTAVERGQLCLHYQPKIHLPTGRVTGVEALLRWDHPELGLLEPSRFISLAEETGLIIPVGEWALEEACRQNEEWRRAGFADLTVAVNLSARQFQQQRIEDVTARILRTTGLDPALLELELTESLAMQDPEAISKTLQELKDMGVSCSIDDFGTGYSGLSYLTQFPIDTLKIDKSFVATIDDTHDAPIVVAVIALAHGLGLKVVAEGVETSRQLDRLRELGCDEMQGFLFSRPIPADLFEQLLMLEAISPGPGRLVVP